MTLPLIVFPIEFVVTVLNLGTYDAIDGDASRAQGCVQRVGEYSLPFVSTVVRPALAGVDSYCINLTKIMFSFLELHGFDHGFVVQ